MIHILLTIVIMHYTFLISFGITKIFKFQIYYPNSHCFNEIIMITKTLTYNYNGYYSNN